MLYFEWAWLNSEESFSRLTGGGVKPVVFSGECVVQVHDHLRRRLNTFFVFFQKRLKPLGRLRNSKISFSNLPNW